MSQIYYSKSAGSFYIEGVHPVIPADKVPISETVWQHLLAAQSPNSQLSADAAGNPILINPADSNAVVYTSVGQS